jgi:hypothetical protein
MRHSICSVILLLGVGVCAKEPARIGYGKCAENDESAGYPLKGWVGYTNTGKPVPDMTVQALLSRDKQPEATAKTDEAGRFSFPTLGPGKFYLRATKKLVGEIVSAEAVVTVRKELLASFA